MHLSSATLDAIKALISRDHVLLEQLSAAPDPASAARLLAQAAQRQGVEVQADQIEAYYGDQLRGAPSEISDDALASVAGGIDRMTRSELIAFSVFTVAIGCAVYSKEHGNTDMDNCQVRTPYG